LVATLFSAGSILHGTRLSEALAYAVAVGVVAGFFGIFIGMAVGIGNLALLGGALDMAGNVRAWVHDCYNSYRTSPQTNPTGPASAEY
jgi:hypothetical protein